MTKEISIFDNDDSQIKRQSNKTNKRIKKEKIFHILFDS